MEGWLTTREPPQATSQQQPQCVAPEDTLPFARHFLLDCVLFLFSDSYKFTKCMLTRALGDEDCEVDNWRDEHFGDDGRHGC